MHGLFEWGPDLKVRLLGTAAGGGFPQWNCRCEVCQAAREGRAQARSQSCAAFSADGRQWFLLNASPDVCRQVEAFPPLRAHEGGPRGSAIQGVLITNADLDHSLGLFLLREGAPLRVHAPPAVQECLSQGLRLDGVLKAYCGVEWSAPPRALGPLLLADGRPSGLSYCAFEVPGKLPRYMGGAPARADAAVGYRIVDPATGGRLVFVPDLAGLDQACESQLRDCDALLLDGTFWEDGEMQKRGVGTWTARQMAHLPVGGPQGSLARLQPFSIRRKIYLHINNTNPMLIDGSPERQAVEAAGAELGWDGMEFEV
jgi:pyrroloquinoline quinone biosynthesis protein B